MRRTGPERSGLSGFLTSEKIGSLAVSQTRGQVTVHPEFNVAREGQLDIVKGGRRYLLTRRDNNLFEYKNILKQSGQKTLQVSKDIPTNSQYTWLEIPRDARTLQQVVFSSETEEASRDRIFGKFGRTIAQIRDRVDKIPEATDVDLQHVLYLKASDEIVLVPPLRFIEASIENTNQLIESVHDQLQPEAPAHNTYELLNDFKEGIA